MTVFGSCGKPRRDPTRPQPCFSLISFQASCSLRNRFTTQAQTTLRFLMSESDETSTRSAEGAGPAKGYSVSSTTSEPGATNNDSNSSFNLAASETRLVSRSKIVVYLVVVIAAFTLGATTYHFIRTEENQEFETTVS